MSFPVTLKDRRKRDKTHQQVMDELRVKFKEVKGVRVSMRDISARNLTSGRLFPVSFNLMGPDLRITDSAAFQPDRRAFDIVDNRGFVKPFQFYRDHRAHGDCQEKFNPAG